MVQYTQTGALKIAYTDQAGPQPALILLHGLTANMSCFNGMLHAGLSGWRRCVSLDLRGRGLSDKPDAHYSQADHAADVLSLMDELGIEQAVLVGHSFGGLLSMYLAAHHPQRFPRLIVMDAGLEATNADEVLPKLKPSLDRLGRVFPSMDVYLSAIKQAPYYADYAWNADIEAYYRADVLQHPDGTVQARAQAGAIEAAVKGVVAEDWPAILARIQQPVLLLNAPASFGPPGASPILSAEGAQETVDALLRGKLQTVPGHHITMLFGDHAAHLVEAIRAFLAEA